MKRAMRTPDARIVLLPRNQKQKQWIMKEWPEWFAGDKTIIPGTAVDGLNLLWHSDLVVSGGGTMNREAAAIGVPVYSIFRGPIGAVDHYLQREGRLILVESVADVDRKITLTRRNRNLQAYSNGNQSMARIIEHLEDMLAARRPA
jgi:predicted glycosyltransferase